MIMTLTPNPALDVTYRTPEIRLGQVNRVSVTSTPGGKGVNVARVLAQLGHDVACAGFLGGSTGDQLRELLAPTGLTEHWTTIAGATRTTVGVVEDSGEATMFNEGGPTVDAADWRRLTDTLLGALSAGDVLTISGSLPPGSVGADLPKLLNALHSHGVLTLVDTSGPGLLDAARAGAVVLKPNHHELLESTGTADVVVGAAELLALGAHAVVVSQGEDGVTLVLPGDGDDGGCRVWRAKPTEVLVGNPTGAGDAAVAALALALAEHGDGLALASALSQHLPDVVALSGAAVLAPVAGVVDLPAFTRMRDAITVEETHAAL